MMTLLDACGWLVVTAVIVTLVLCLVFPKGPPGPGASDDRRW